jgi:hypothetical protein
MLRCNYVLVALAVCLFAGRLNAADGAKHAQPKPNKATGDSAVSSADHQESKPNSVEKQGAGEAAPIAETAATVEWMDDYVAAMDKARAENKLMLIHFFRASDQRRKEAGQAADSVANVEQAFSTPEIQPKLGDYVLVKLPIDTAITYQRKPLKVLDHAAFSELHKGPGIAVIDFAHPNADYFGYVVSVLPFTPGKYYRFRTSHLNALMTLPEGTLTQRSMIFAVRIHPEHPASTNGTEDPILLSEATGHSNYQADVQVQGHQGWGSRFQRIIGKLLGRGTPGTPVEVVAESWPDQDLMDSCVDCVASWRQSEGHWDAVKAQQASYGYDIREGANGIWYATGIFRPKQ